METASDPLDRVLDITANTLKVSPNDASEVVDGMLGALETLLDEHRALMADELLAEADRYTKGAFADGIRHAASVVLNAAQPDLGEGETA